MRQQSGKKDERDNSSEQYVLEGAPPLPLVLGWGEQVPPATRFAPLADSWTLHSGARLRKGRIAYETLGKRSRVKLSSCVWRAVERVAYPVD